MADLASFYASHRKRGMVMIKLQAPYGRKHRVSSDSAWPLRNSEGLTFAEAKRRREQEQGK